MRRVVHRAERVRHGVHYAQPDVGKAHARNVLTERHAFPAVLFVIDRAAERFGYNLDSF